MDLYFVHESPPQHFICQVEVAATYVMVDGKFLFLKIAGEKKEKGSFGVPAGKIETNELPVVAAQRELFEETGILTNLENLIPLTTLYIEKSHVSFTYHMFALHLQDFPIVNLSDEHNYFEWATFEEAKKLPLMTAAIETLMIFNQLQEFNMKTSLPPLSKEALSITPGSRFQHYKGFYYTVLSIARHSETLEELIVYQAEYGEKGIWVRPLQMFLEEVLIDGKMVPRFRPIH